jgi:hypothetical protein
MSRLLVEYCPISYGQQLIREASEPHTPLVLKNVVLQRADAKNQNGRIYPREILMREAKKYHEEFVAQRRALGELDHPESPVVNLKNVCSNIIRMEVVGDNVVGDIQILSTPAGHIVRELIRNNIRLGVSSRGLGSVKSVSENTVEVQDDFSLICFDIVSNPSTYGAFINESVIGAQPSTPIARLNSLIYDFLGEIQ